MTWTTKTTRMTIKEVPMPQTKSGASGPPATVGPSSIQTTNNNSNLNDVFVVGCVATLFLVVGLLGFVLLLLGIA